MTKVTWILVSLVVMLEGRLELRSLQDSSINLILRTVPVPYNKKEVIESVDGLLIWPHNETTLYQMVNQSSSMIVLCNISSDGGFSRGGCSEYLTTTAKAILSCPSYFTSDPGRNYFYIDYPPQDMAPVLELSETDYKTMIQFLTTNNWTVLGTIYSNETNPWIDMFNSAEFIFAQCLISFVGLVNIIGSLYCLFYTSLDGFPRVSDIILCIELVSHLIRVVWFSVDPIYSRLLLGYVASNILESITFPFTLTASLLIAIFWYKIFQKTKLQNESLMQKIRIIFFIIISFTFTLELSFALSRILVGSNTYLDYFQTINIGIYLLLNLGIFVFYVYTGYSVIRYLKFQSDNLQSRKTSQMRRIRNLLVATSLVLFILLLVNVLFATPLFTHMHSFVAIWCLLVFFLEVLGLCHIIAFWPKQKRSPWKTTINSGDASTHSKRRTNTDVEQ